MYRVNDDTKNAYKSDVSYKSVEVRIPGANITLTNDDILADSLELKEAIESEDNLSFQGCIAASFKIECFNLVDDTLVGQWIECDITADETETIPLFRGYISEVTNTTHEEFTTEIRAYDALYTINNSDITSWYNSLSFPISILNMRNSFFAHFGITQESTYLANDPMSVRKTIEDKVITGSRIIKSICQVNGVFGRISREGLFQYVQLVEGTEALYPREDLYPADDLYPSAENALESVNKAHFTDISFENYRVAPITRVQIIDKDGQIVVASGSGNNVFTLKDNPLVWDKSASELISVANNLYNTIQGLWYTPSNIECVGLPYVECGDFVLMAARRSIVRAYVLSRTLKGIQILKDSYEANGDRTQPTYIPDVVTKVNANSSAISSEVSRASSAEYGLNTSIGNEVSRAKSAEGAIDSRVNSLSANVANIGTLVAQKANISDLTALDAKIERLTANKITANEARVIFSQSITSFSGTLYCNSIRVNGTTYSRSRTFNTYYMNGKGEMVYNGQVTCLGN